MQPAHSQAWRTAPPCSRALHCPARIGARAFCEARLTIAAAAYQPSAGTATAWCRPCGGRAAHPCRAITPMASHSAVAAKPVVKVDIWSDLSCPWCWVGKKRFDKAVQQFAEADFDIVYHSYVIDHGTAPEGEEYLAYNVRRWGSDGWCAGLRRSGRPDGAAFADWVTWPNSVKAHQLLLLAQEQGKGREAKEALLRATYEEGRNISQVDTLVQVAASLQLQQGGDEVRRYLQRDEGREAVLADDATGKRELNISGVPYFIVGGLDGSGRRHALSGAQPASAFAQAFSKVLADQ